MSFCAICTGDIATSPPKQAPIGKGNALVNVCDACNDDMAIEKRGPDRNCDHLTSKGQMRDARDSKGTAKLSMTSFQSAPAGWETTRVPRKDGGGHHILIDGNPIDSKSAFASLRDKPWFGPGRVRYIGCSELYFIYAYAPHASMALPSDPNDPLEAIRKHQVLAPDIVTPKRRRRSRGKR